MKKLLLSLALSFMLAAPAFAGEFILMDYTGYGFEDGGVPTSNPGDVLVITAVAQSLRPDVQRGARLRRKSRSTSMISSAPVSSPVGADTYIGYIGGKIEIYEDANLDHDWGLFPPNPEHGDLHERLAAPGG